MKKADQLIDFVCEELMLSRHTVIQNQTSGAKRGRAVLVGILRKYHYMSKLDIISVTGISEHRVRTALTQYKSHEPIIDKIHADFIDYRSNYYKPYKT